MDGYQYKQRERPIPQKVSMCHTIKPLPWIPQSHTSDPLEESSSSTTSSTTFTRESSKEEKLGIGRSEERGQIKEDTAEEERIKEAKTEEQRIREAEEMNERVKEWRSQVEEAKARERKNRALPAARGREEEQE
jgi:hypothetical protein